MKWGLVLLAGAGICFMLFFVNALAVQPYETAANVFALAGAILFLSALYIFARALRRAEQDAEQKHER